MATIGQSGSSSPGPVVVGDDRRRGRAPCACATSSTAVIPQSTVSTSPQPSPASRVERLAGDAVALLEAARQVPVDLGAELAEDEDGERRRADPVDVVVAVDADPRPGRDRGADALAPPRACRRAGTGRGPGDSPARNAAAAAGSPYPRRTSTLAVVSLSPSSLRQRARLPRIAGRIVQVASTMDRRRYARGRTEPLRPRVRLSGCRCARTDSQATRVQSTTRNADRAGDHEDDREERRPPSRTTSRGAAASERVEADAERQPEQREPGAGRHRRLSLGRPARAR